MFWTLNTKFRYEEGTPLHYPLLWRRPPCHVSCLLSRYIVVFWPCFASADWHWQLVLACNLYTNPNNHLKLHVTTVHKYKSSGYLAMHFSRHGWCFEQTRCPHLQGTIIRTSVLIHPTTGRRTWAVTPVTLTWLHVQRMDMVTSRLWVGGANEESHDLTAVCTGVLCCLEGSPAGANESGDCKRQKPEWSYQRNGLDTSK